MQGLLLLQQPHALCGRPTNPALLLAPARLPPQIQKDTPITLQYGRHTNAQLVLSYGFHLPGAE